MSTSHTHAVVDANGAEWIEAEVLLVPVDGALHGLHDLHLRSTGEREELPDAVLGLSPIDALNHYEESTAALLAQIAISDVSFARDLIDSVDAFGRDEQSIDGLEGVLATCVLKIDGDDVRGSVDRAAGLIRDLGVSESLGGGRGASHAVDAAHKVVADLGAEALHEFGRHSGADAVAALRDGLSAPTGADGGAGSSALQIFGGLLTMAVGALVSTLVPPVGAALEAVGAATFAHGLDALHHPHQPQHGGGASPAGAGADHGMPFKVTETHYEKTTTHPDGSVTTEKFTSHTTEGIAVQAHPKGSPHGGEDKIWDDAGGFDETGRPVPINPLAVLMCQLDEPQPGEDGKVLLDILPLLGPLGEVVDAGGFAVYASYVASDAVRLEALETVVHEVVEGVPLEARCTWSRDQTTDRAARDLQLRLGHGDQGLIVEVPGDGLAWTGPLTVRKSTGTGDEALVPFEALSPRHRAIASDGVESLRALVDRVSVVH